MQTLDDSVSDYILQCINHQVFTDVDMLQHNIEVVTAHIRKKLEEKQTKDIDRKVLRFLKSDTGKTYYFDGKNIGGCVSLFRIPVHWMLLPQNLLIW